MKFFNFKSLYIKFDAYLKLEKYVKRCVYVSTFKWIFFFSILMKKICFYVKKTIFFSFLLNFSKITEDKTWKCTQKKVWNFQQTLFPTTLKLTFLGFAFQNTVKLLVIAHKRVKHFFVEKCCFWVIFMGSHLSKKKKKKRSIRHRFFFILASKDE